MKRIGMALAAAVILGGIATSGWGKDYPSISAIKKDGKAVVGKTVTIRLKPQSIIVRNGVFSLVDREGSLITLAVPSSMKKKIKGLNTSSFYNCTIKIDEISPDSARGIIVTISD